MITDYFAHESPSALHDILGLKDNAQADIIAYPFKALPSFKEVWFEVLGTNYTGTVSITKDNEVVGELFHNGTLDLQPLSY